MDTRAVLPDLKGNGLIEPLFAYYDHKCLELFEKIVSEGSCRPGDLIGKPGVITPVVPQLLHFAWKNCNFSEDIDS
jgi:molybdopterin-guanine dinucleotide biosynthesis protein A